MWPFLKILHDHGSLLISASISPVSDQGNPSKGYLKLDFTDGKNQDVDNPFLEFSGLIFFCLVEACFLVLGQMMQKIPFQETHGLIPKQQMQSKVSYWMSPPELHQQDLDFLSPHPDRPCPRMAILLGLISQDLPCVSSAPGSRDPTNTGLCSPITKRSRGWLFCWITKRNSAPQAQLHEAIYKTRFSCSRRQEKWFHSELCSVDKGN